MRIRAELASANRERAEPLRLQHRPRPFVQFLEYAKASLEETQDHLIQAKTRALIDASLFSRLWNLARAAERATTNLLLSKLRQVKEERTQRRATAVPTGTRRVRPGQKNRRMK